MTVAPRTQFVNGKSPFPRAPKAPTVYVDPNKLKIADDPLPTERASTQKYEALFSKLKLGQCIKCQPDDVGKIANSMRKWAAEHRKGAIVKSTSKYPQDGQGRVWLLKDGAC